MVLAAMRAAVSSPTPNAPVRVPSKKAATSLPGAFQPGIERRRAAKAEGEGQFVTLGSVARQHLRLLIVAVLQHMLNATQQGVVLRQRLSLRCGDVACACQRV